ncbi:MAG: hypothetical protein AAF908_00285 [Pseudomonadota bacterium]
MSGSTLHIGRRAAENICHAFDYAKHIGRPLNTYVVVNLGDFATGLAATMAFERIRHKYRDWLSRKYAVTVGEKEPPRYVYTLEAPNEHDHANWVVHIPPPFLKEFLKKLPRWVRRVTGNSRPFDIEVQTVDPETDKSLAKYVIKGTNEKYVEYLHLKAVAAPQGRIWGRRCGTSPSIGRTARKRAGFVPRRDRNEWRRLAA